MPETEKKEPRMMVGVIVLMTASLLEKILGVVFKIPLNDILGSKGMGYFNSAYSIFSTFYTISLTGFPIAVSIMVSKSRAKGRVVEVNRIFRAALCVFIALGLIGTSIMFFGSGVIAGFIDSENNSPLCIRAISPILLIICLSGSIKGFFQGHNNMMPTAVSEFADALGKCTLGVLLGTYAAGKGYSIEICAAYAIAGVTLGHLFGLAFLMLFKTVSKPKYGEKTDNDSQKYGKIIKNLFLIAIPITLSSVALGLMANIDTFTIMNVLKSGDGMEKYGDYTTLVVTLFRLPQAFILPISAALTPALSSSISSDDKERATSIMSSSIRLAAGVALPCTFGLSVLAYPIIYLLFGNDRTQTSVASNAPYLSILALGVFFMAILTVTSSMLQAHKLQKFPVISAFCGMATKLILNIVLMSSFGMIGAPISSVAGYFIMAAMNVVFVKKYVYKDMKIVKPIWKSFISAAIMGSFAFGSYKLMEFVTSNIRISVIISVLISIIVYFTLNMLIGGIKKEDILLMPRGEKIYGFFKKIKLMK